MNLNLSGRTAIITGASRGIGAAVATELAREGVSVALIARTAPAVERLADDLHDRHGVTTIGIAADVADLGQLGIAIERAVSRLGGVDVLVNNAGASPHGGLEAIDDAAWQAAFELKLLGYVRCIRAVLPTMRSQKSGRIVNVVGMSGRYATPGYVLGSLNAALLHLTKALAVELGPDGIGVVAINPTLVDTDRMRAALPQMAVEADQDFEEFRRAVFASVPLRRMATVDEIARLIVVLCSDVSAYTTGGALQADGGASLGAF